MSKRIKKVGITGKFGVRYGSSLRKRAKICMDQKKKKYECPFCGKSNVRWQAIGLWKCKSCEKVMSGGGYTFETPLHCTIKQTLSRTE
ncbi:60S ribosomal protein L37 [Trachipleistophora hominis]|uniref:60S ribosomal protein L37 n=1 Tax=Trachipleistophora hominis TaxID=72359 RepID=L7JVF9_TRAHO|nr:60S ribosomal protein L37 [Trachipleistophora hominis]